MNATVCFKILGFDLYAEVVFHVTYKGFKGTYYDPPEPPEFSVDELTLYKDGHNDSPQLECPQWLQGVIEESDELYERMLEEYYSSQRD